MEIKRDEVITILGILVAFIVTYYIPPSNMAIVYFFIAILIVIGVIYTFWYFRDKFGVIENNRNELNIIKDKLKIREEINIINQKVSKLEGWKEAIENIAMKRRSKGQISPIVVLVIILVIIIILYLRSQSII